MDVRRENKILNTVFGVDLGPVAGMVLLHEVDDAVRVIPLFWGAARAILLQNAGNHF